MHCCAGHCGSMSCVFPDSSPRQLWKTPTSGEGHLWAAPCLQDSGVIPVVLGCFFELLSVGFLVLNERFRPQLDLEGIRYGLLEGAG